MVVFVMEIYFYSMLFSIVDFTQLIAIIYGMTYNPYDHYFKQAKKS